MGKAERIVNLILLLLPLVEKLGTEILLPLLEELAKWAKKESENE